MNNNLFSKFILVFPGKKWCDLEQKTRKT